mmetsp:Transcript_28856/g.31499  ORF Transcript_28856/g.31499 Transcript_28856/m.31499 type:complete len:204 (+) Transcript_28856:84-695(+)|eukprot:gene3742-3998_t
MTTTNDVLLYYPNLIGYARFLFMLISFATATTNWKLSILSYVLAFVGDVVDGYVARAFNQCSKFGGVLDMVTDRVSTCGLLVVVSHLYPSYALYFILLIVLDITSHWFHVMSVSAHHKSKEALEHRNALLQWYYSIYPLFGYCCVGTELFYILLYVLHHHPHPLIHQICFFGCLPACILKQLVNVVQLSSAAHAIAEIDTHKD